MNVQYQNGVRKQGDLSAIETVKLTTLAQHLKADGARIVMRKADGVEYLHLTNSKTDEYISIKVGPKVSLDTTGEKRVADLISGYVVYMGDKDINGNQLEKPWFTFGPEPTPSEPTVEVNAAKLANMLKNSKILVAGV